MKKIALFCICFTFFVLVFFMVADHSYKELSLTAFAKSRQAVSEFTEGLHAFFNKKSLIRENEALKEKLAQQVTPAGYEYLKTENEQLKNALGLESSTHRKTVAGRVVEISTQGDFCITLDRGEVHGVSVGDAVVFGNALAGVVSEVFHSYSVFSPITADNRTTGIADQDGNLGIATGSASLLKNNLCTVSFFGEADVNIGDEITTSGLSDVYPDGLVIGKIHSTDKNITVKTETDFFKTYIFSVILSQ